MNIEFLGANRQFDWIELYLVYDKSDKHTTIYDSYNVEMASKAIKLVRLTNFTKIYSLTNEKKKKKYDIDNLTQKHLLYKQFVAWSCNGSSVAPLTDYMSNPIYQELISEDDCFNVLIDKRIHLDLRASSGYLKEAEKLERNDSKVTLHILLKEEAKKKLRLSVWGYCLGEYLYLYLFIFIFI